MLHFCGSCLCKCASIHLQTERKKMATSKNCLASWRGRHTCHMYIYLASPWNVNVITILQPVIGMRITDAAGPPESMQTLSDSLAAQLNFVWLCRFVTIDSCILSCAFAFSRQLSVVRLVRIAFECHFGVILNLCKRRLEKKFNAHGAASGATSQAGIGCCG